MKKSASGFTIVELLIVIIVIAILAAISIVAYTGIQQRANNSAVIQAASQTIKVLQAYNTQEGGYPVASAYVCVTTDSGCVGNSGTVQNSNATFTTSVAKVGSLPKSVPQSSGIGRGIMYHHDPTRQYDGQDRQAVLIYYLDGQNQKCGLADIMNAWGTPDQIAGPSTTGRTGNLPASNRTYCFVSLPLTR